MGRILLSICAVVVAVGLGGTTQAPGSGPGRQPSAAEGNASASQNIPVATDLGRIASALEAQNTNDAAEREQRDLNAQEEMAIWAKRMFWAAVATVVVSGIGIVLIFVTFMESRRAADAAETMADEAVKATEAANRSAMVTLQASHAQLRPWLRLDVEESDCQWQWEGSGVRATLSLKVTNSGVSPALQCGVSVSGRLISLIGPMEEPIDLPDRLGQMAPLFAGDSFPHGVTIQQTRAQLDAVLAEVQETGGMPCFVFEVKVSYRTPFSDDVKVSALRYLIMGMAGDHGWLAHKGPNVQHIQPRIALRVQPADILT